MSEPIQPPAAALSAPTQLRDILSTLREIMSVYNSSLLEQEHEASRLSAQIREDEFQDVLDAALDPALQMCATMAEMRQTERDRAIFWVNCDEAVLGALEGFEFATERRKRITADEGTHVESLTAEHVRLDVSVFPEPALTTSLSSTPISSKRAVSTS
jgi:hypothetical protein